MRPFNGPEGATHKPTFWQEVTTPAALAATLRIPEHVIWAFLLESAAPEPEINGEWMLSAAYDYVRDRIEKTNRTAQHQPNWWTRQ